MYLDEMLKAQKRGSALGIASVCSAHPEVLRETLRLSSNAGIPALIESTCNQVNQYGGYTGMTPVEFAGLVRGITNELDLHASGYILGGDHLGPSVWQAEAAADAMDKACKLVRAYVQGGFAKLHLDCSMRLGDDPPQGPTPEIIARRAAQLAHVAEACRQSELRYVIGTEVPAPGGAAAVFHRPRVSAVAGVQQAIDLHREAFCNLGLESAWERVLAIVVQPGVEFGDDFVAEYEPAEAAPLSHFIESQTMIYEAHSTDYQSRDALKQMVEDHFAILKVGPALTFAYREAVFALAAIEDQLVPADERSHLIEVVEQAMLCNPLHWREYYRGSEAEQAYKRKHSLSDRIRYYWSEPGVVEAVRRLQRNLQSLSVPQSLLSGFLLQVNETDLSAARPLTYEDVVSQRISQRLEDYFAACNSPGP